MAMERNAGDGEGRFVWPPRRPESAVVNRSSSAPSRPERQQTRPPGSRTPDSVWRSFEREVLGLTAGPLADRVLAADWRPDRPDDYCGRCGQSTHAHERRPGGCHRCDGIKQAWVRTVRLGEYRGVLREWIHEVKFTRWRRLGVDLGHLLGESLREQWERDVGKGAPGAGGAPPILVPIPDSALRRIWRGIDHAGAIAAGVREATGWSMARPLRRRWGKSQRSVPTTQRGTNATRAFSVHSGFDWKSLSGRTVVLLDDVVTSGATMRACGKLIVSACRETASGVSASGLPSVWCGCLARTPLDEPGRKPSK